MQDADRRRPYQKVEYQCGCTAGGDNIAMHCPIHDVPIKKDIPNDRLRLAELCGLNAKEMMGNIRYWERKKADWLIWHPDESIEQAMMVAEAMVKQDYKFRLIIDKNGCTAIFTKNRGIWDCEYNTQYISEAICRAALAALDHAASSGSDSIAPVGQNGIITP